ncbi:hypothetical protein MTO96_044826, partial [Rhipicephalus appendiculatus]
AAEQSAYLLSWFGEYSDLQRDDFLHVLADKYAPLEPDSDDDLGMSRLAIVNPDAPPSLFQCRMSLFDQWFQVNMSPCQHFSGQAGCKSRRVTDHRR